MPQAVCTITEYLQHTNKKSSCANFRNCCIEYAYCCGIFRTIHMNMNCPIKQLFRQQKEHIGSVYNTYEYSMAQIQVYDVDIFV